MRISGLLAFVCGCLAVCGPLRAEEPKQAEKGKVVVGEKAPEFKIKDPTGKTIDLAELTAKGPVLVRLTCGCARSTWTRWATSICDTT